MFKKLLCKVIGHKPKSQGRYFVRKCERCDTSLWGRNA